MTKIEKNVLMNCKFPLFFLTGVFFFNCTDIVYVCVCVVHESHCVLLISVYPVYMRISVSMFVELHVVSVCVCVFD